MKKLIILALLMSASASAQTNFGFERVEKGVPAGWHSQNEGAVSDSTHVHSGSYSVMLKAREGSFQALSFRLPHNYKGREITLSGWIRTEDVTDGWAGLYMNIDPFKQFDNMEGRGAAGTAGWRRFEITMPLKPEQATEKIVVGAALVGGAGAAWFDDFAVTVDGVNLSRAAFYEPVRLPADDDTEFDGGSGIVTLPAGRAADLARLGKTWAFLKYNNPAIAAGRWNWDAELFRFLPKYLADPSEKNLREWAESLGAAAVSDTNYYVRIGGGYGASNPYFLHERNYANLDAGVRLLALFRYWAAVKYFYPARSEAWDEVLERYVAPFLEARNELEYQLAVLRLTGEIEDSHAFMAGADKIDSLRGGNVAPFEAVFVGGKLAVAADGGMFKRGDVISEINGRPVSVIVDSLMPWYPASNRAARLRNIAHDILRSPRNALIINGIAQPLRPLKNSEPEEKEAFRMLTDSIGCIDIGAVRAKYLPQIRESLNAAKGVIIDLRRYPKEFITSELGDWFVERETPFALFTWGDIAHPGAFPHEYTAALEPTPAPYRGRVAVLINENTQSMGELTAMALRAAGAVIIGSQTAGADGDISKIDLPGGLSTWISGMGVYYPDGTPTQRIGIVPDIELHPTLRGLREGRDELLDRAVEILDDNVN